MNLPPVPAMKAATLLMAVAAVLTACIPAPSRGQVAGATPSTTGATSSSTPAPVPAPSGQPAPAESPIPTAAAATSGANSPADAAVLEGDPSARSSGWAVIRVVDGDTIDVTRDGVKQKVRFIGIDAPEIGQCGYAEATRNLQALIAGRAVTLVPGAKTDTDRYDRLLRYVDVAGVDTGLRQIQGGFAVAKYDSRDGYGAHLRETAYVAADASSAASGCPAGAAPAAQPTRPASPSPSVPAASAWPVAGDRFPCPQGRPVKGNASSMIAHSPGQQSYLVTNPEQCFVDLASAQGAGYRAAKR